MENNGTEGAHGPIETTIYQQPVLSVTASDGSSDKSGTELLSRRLFPRCQELCSLPVATIPGFYLLPRCSCLNNERIFGIKFSRVRLENRPALERRGYFRNPRSLFSICAKDNYGTESYLAKVGSKLWGNSSELKRLSRKQSNDRK